MSHVALLLLLSEMWGDHGKIDCVCSPSRSGRDDTSLTNVLLIGCMRWRDRFCPDRWQRHTAEEQPSAGPGIDHPSWVCHCLLCVRCNGFFNERDRVFDGHLLHHRLA